MSLIVNIDSGNSKEDFMDNISEAFKIDWKVDPMSRYSLDALIDWMRDLFWLQPFTSITANIKIGRGRRKKEIIMKPWERQIVDILTTDIASHWNSQGRPFTVNLL